MRSTLLLLALAPLCLATLHAAAARADELPAASADSAAPAREGAPPLDEAERLYYEAETRFATGDVKGALVAMQRSFDLSGRPELLFNLGELHRELGNCDAARRSYQRYLSDVADARFRERASAGLAALERTCGHAVPRVTPPAPVPAPEVPYWTGPRILGWSLVGASVAAGICSAYFTIRAQNSESALERAVARNRSLPPDERRPWEDVGQERYSEGKRAATFAYAFGAGAAAALVGGAGLLWFGAPRDAAASAHRLSVALSPEMVSGALSVDF